MSTEPTFVRTIEERNALVYQYRFLPHHVLGRMYARHQPSMTIFYEDCLSEARLALLRAARTWRADREANFTSYAYRAIERALKDFLVEYASTRALSVPKWIGSWQAHVQHRRKMGMCVKRGKPKIPMVGTLSGKRYKDVDLPFREEEEQNRKYELADAGEVDWARVLARLSPLEAQIIARHFLAGEQIKTICLALHRCRTMIQQAKRSALAKLRVILEGKYANHECKGQAGP